MRKRERSARTLAGARMPGGDSERFDDERACLSLRHARSSHRDSTNHARAVQGLSSLSVRALVGGTGGTKK